MKKNITIILILLLTILSSSIPAAASSKIKSNKKEAAKHEKIMEAMKILQTGQFQIKQYNSKPDDMYGAAYYAKYDLHNSRDYEDITQSLDTTKQLFTISFRKVNAYALSLELNLKTGYLRKIWPDRFGRSTTSYDYTCILPLTDTDNPDYTKPHIQRKIVDSGALLQSGSIPAAASSKTKSDKKEAAKHEKIMEAMKILQTGQFRIKYYIEPADRVDYNVTNPASIYYRYDIADPEYISTNRSMDTVNGTYTVRLVRKNGDVTNIELNLNSGYLKFIFPMSFSSFHNNRGIAMLDYASIFPLYDTDNIDYTKPRIQRKIVDSYNLLQSGSFMISMPLAGLSLADGLGLVVDPRDGRTELVSSAFDISEDLYTARYITDKAAGTSAELRYNYRDGSLEVDIYEGDEPIITQSGSYKHIVAAPR